MEPTTGGSPTDWPTRIVPVGLIRECFNSSGLWEASEKPPPYMRTRRSQHTPRPENNQPVGTQSEMWAIVDQRIDVKVALVHLYRHQDGSTSRPDPKWLALDGQVLIPA